jgi:hypothetical protein
MGGHEESNTKETLMHDNINKDENSWGNANKKIQWNAEMLYEDFEISK